MSERIIIGGVEVPAVAVVVLGYLVFVGLIFLIRQVVSRALRRFSKYTKTHLDDIFLDAGYWPVTLLILAGGGFVVPRFLPPERAAAFYVSFVPFFKAVAIFASVLFVNRFLLGLVEEYTPRVPLLKATEGIARVVIRIAVFGLGGLILLDSIGVSITPLIASLGVGSLAIALALQPTLENFFSGIQLLADKPVQIGHFVKLESGEEGYVEKIGWRTTWVRMLPNNMVIMPNKNLVNAKIINYYYPEKEMAVPVELGVHYNSDLEKVEKITIEVAQETLREVSGGVPGFSPVVRYHTFGDFSINFAVVLRAKEFTDQGLLKHEFIKRLHKRYAKEGIVIPYPIQAINTDQEGTPSDFRKA